MRYYHFLNFETIIILFKQQWYKISTTPRFENPVFNSPRRNHQTHNSLLRIWWFYIIPYCFQLIITENVINRHSLPAFAQLSHDIYFP